MPTTLLMDGRSPAADLVAATRRRAEAVTATLGRRPCLATVLIGDDPASATYVRMKQRRCRDAGIDSRHVALGQVTTTAEAVAAVSALSADATVDGILVQHPTPAQVDERAVFEAIDPAKDVDGVTLSSFAAMALDADAGFRSCTPIVGLLDHHGVELDGAHVVVIGCSPILGKPLALLLLARHATVTSCHVRTRDLAAHVAAADLVVAAAGSPGLVRGSWLKPGCVVVDAGYSPGNLGDVATDEAMGIASMITPVPGGVGPMTIATLLAQTVDAAGG
ncbi:MAG: tetrahydrofolate dehydrogenase/cyclohydrolase catalytic domain-containing protein [Actinomycetota bacterium]|nr:tetrahydrofolate dehydrogenase/cyclohydrolase catalytic domain-containing protein [Actinomycetota bacterium]